MRGVGYALLQALRGLRSTLLIQLAATGAIAVGLLLVGLVLVTAVNVEGITRQWGRGIQIVVYLRSGATPAGVTGLARLLQDRPEVTTVRRVSSAEARRRLETSLGGKRGLLDGLEAETLPASLEVGLAGDRPEAIRPLLALLQTSPMVEEVDHLGSWTARLSTLVQLLQAVGLAIALIVGLACLYIVGSTIRLGIHARREEIEILRLVGAGRGMIKAPFLFEGALQGLVGSLIAATLLYLLFRTAAPRVEAMLGSALSYTHLTFLPVGHLLGWLIGGTVLGIAGSRMALGRYLDA